MPPHTFDDRIETMWFARWVFLLSAIYGFLVLSPMIFMEAQIGQKQPPAITHAEYFYGFVGVALSWQVAFLLISRDPIRFRPLMLPGVLEKFSFGTAGLILFAQGRLAAPMLAGAIVDLLMGILFIAAWQKTPRKTMKAE